MRYPDIEIVVFTAEDRSNWIDKFSHAVNTLRTAEVSEAEIKLFKFLASHGEERRFDYAANEQEYQHLLNTIKDWFDARIVKSREDS